MDKFLNSVNNYVLKYAYYREVVAGSKYFDLNYELLNLNELVQYEFDTKNEYDDKAIKLIQNDMVLGYVHRSFIQEMIQTYHKKKDFKIEIILNKINIEKEELGFQIAFYQAYNNKTFNVLNRIYLNCEAIKDKYYNLKKDKKTNQYYILENNYVLTNSEVKKIKSYLDNNVAILLIGKEDNQIEVIIVI